jgi:hypothetical protein
LELVRQRAENGSPIATKTEAANRASVNRKTAFQAWGLLLSDGAIELRDDSHPDVTTPGFYPSDWP